MARIPANLAREVDAGAPLILEISRTCNCQTGRAGRELMTLPNRHSRTIGV
jgi:hypothetical protein